VVEAALESEPAVDHERADKGGGTVALGVELFREERHLRSHLDREVLAHAVVKRVEPREEGRMGGHGLRDRGLAAFEKVTASGDPVEVGADLGVAAVAAEHIRAGRVEGHEQDVGPGCPPFSARNLAAGRGLGHRHQNQEGKSRYASDGPRHQTTSLRSRRMLR